MFICTPGLAGKTQNFLNSGVSLLFDEEVLNCHKECHLPPLFLVTRFVYDIYVIYFLTLFCSDNWQSTAWLSGYSERPLLTYIVIAFESSLVCLVWTSIVKQVFTSYINHTRVRFLEPTSAGVIWGIMFGALCRARTNDPWDEM